MEQILKVNKILSDIFNEDDFYLVGGCVRDAVMGNTIKDYDICGPLLPDAVKSIVEGVGLKTFNVNGLEFGTISFFIEVSGEKLPIEYTTFRSEIYTSKSRKPEVKFVPSLDEDLARRDFTMNAMVLRSDGSIYDPYGGKLDIYAKQIKTVGMPKDRIQEDPLRIFRAARFAARYGFSIDPNFIGKARQLADRIYDVSIERWVMELDKLLTADHVYTGMTELDKMGVLRRVLPEIYNADDQPLIRDPSPIKDPDEAWAYLLKASQWHVFGPHKSDRLTKYVNSGICHRLKFSNARIDLVLDKTRKKD